MRVSQGKQVSVEFTISLDDKTVIGSNVGDDPIVFIQGTGKILPAIERAIDGMEAGTTTRITLQAGDSYGPIDLDAIQSIDASRIPDRSRYVGASLHASGVRGIRGRVVEVKDDVIVVDFNHPLAGKELIVEVKVLDVKTHDSRDRD